MEQKIIKVNIFEDEECNAMAQALVNCAQAEDFFDDKVYDYMENCPRSSFIVFMVDELKELGYSIVKDK